MTGKNKLNLSTNKQSAINSFTYRAPKTWTDFSYLRWIGNDNPASRIGKIKLEQFLAKNSMPHLKVIKKFNSASDIKFSSLPDCFVLKPTSLWSGKGVMLLHRIYNHRSFFDSKSGKVFTEKEILESAHRIEKELNGKVSFMAEERAIDEDEDINVPLDYKVFTFHGVTKFIFQVNRNHTPPRIAFFDGNFNPILDDRVSIPEGKKAETTGVHRIPACADDILALAKQITLKLNAPFISVDCYATKKGAMLGELTHTPGGPWYRRMYHFSDQFDLELGKAWEDACARLNISIPRIKVPYEIKSNGKVIRTVY
jgi:hypothetical protein